MNKVYKLLFVDDEVRVLRSLKSLFRRDYEVLVANSGQKALEILATDQIDVIVSDQRMPNMTGNELLALVNQRFPQVMRILLTGYVDKEAIIKTINEGEIYRYIHKPWDNNEIRAIVKQAADASQHKLTLTSVSRYPVKKLIHVQKAPDYQRNLVDMPLEASHLPFPQAPRAQSTSRTRSIKEKKQSIILMDRDQNMRNSIRLIGRRLGFSVYGVNSSMQAVRTLAIRSDVAIAILSTAIDPKNILGIINLLKQSRPALSVIALTEVTDSIFAIDLINKGQVFRYLQKPVNHQELEFALLSAVKRHNMLKQTGELNERYQVESLSRTSSNFQKLKSLFKQSA